MATTPSLNDDTPLLPLTGIVCLARLFVWADAVLLALSLLTLGVVHVLGWWDASYAIVVKSWLVALLLHFTVTAAVATIGGYRKGN